MKRLLLIAVLALAASCGRDAKEHVVIMRGMVFDPPSLALASGDRVTWRNEDIVAHTATAAGRFDSGEVAPGASYTVTIKERGEVKYACTLHPTMLAALDVR